MSLSHEQKKCSFRKLNSVIQFFVFFIPPVVKLDRLIDRRSTDRAEPVLRRRTAASCCWKPQTDTSTTHSHTFENVFSLARVIFGVLDKKLLMTCGAALQQKERFRSVWGARVPWYDLLTHNWPCHLMLAWSSCVSASAASVPDKYGHSKTLLWMSRWIKTKNHPATNAPFHCKQLPPSSKTQRN